ncbi:RNA 2',3'-cyclic phosphodiesterase [Oceanithermus sp.]|uniref:RNA 2',3'-cyclic phosphodiesterase n=1 Tax=Oceanithermus sp. TaxID=2268145 RepID=UPI00257BC6DA|nr:RNA 2',3'-cyclic phosphodiesterase [Oceanithermus sp.]
MRLFYAIFPPRTVQRTLAEAQRSLRGNWKPVREDQIHLTLGFLGDVPEAELARVRRAGRDAARASDPFVARVRGTGFFPNEGRPRVWFARAEGDGFEPLALALREALPEFLADERAFKAHLTLARRKGPAPRVAPVVFDLEFPVEAFALVESRLTPRGPQYTVLDTFALKERDERGKQRTAKGLAKHPQAD